MMDSFMASLATGIGYLVILACLFRVLVPLAGSWSLRAIEQTYFELRRVSAKLSEVEQLEKSYIVKE